MANIKKRLPKNVAGDFFVDSTCINCDTCRQLAPSVFEDDGENSYVQHQPVSTQEEREAFRALLACPTKSIGTQGVQKAGEVMQDFPLPVAEDVYYLGFTAENSFGGQSYLIQHPEGNWMVDSPRFHPHLAKRIAELGGLKYIFLTHQDDVADNQKYAEKLGATRIIHEKDKQAVPNAEELIRGEDAVSFGQDFLVIPTPGHTSGHCVLLYKNLFLFSGDHLWWSRHTKTLSASRRYNWHSWKKQIHSMEKLREYSFEWVLPGHGRRVHYAANQMKNELGQLIQRMKAA